MHDRVWTKSKRVLVVWIICATAFGLFNAAYWPARTWQTWNAEPNFLARAEAAFAENQHDEARQIVTRGIARFHPPTAGVWRFHADLSEGDDATAAAATARWYTAVEEQQSPTVASIFPDGLPPRLTSLNLAHHAAPIRSLHETLLEATFLEQVGAWTPAQGLALLEAAQGRLVIDGAIGRTEVTTPVSLFVQSGGGVGPQRAAHIFVDGIDYASQRRGFHATILDPESGAVLQSGRFDLWEHTQEAHRMLRFLEEAPAGSIGLFAVYDDASVNLDSTLEEALLGFGLHREAWINGRQRVLGIRYSFAAIGVKGSPRGTALQAWTPEFYDEHQGHPVAVVVLRGKDAEI